MRGNVTLSPAAGAVEIVPQNYFVPLDLVSVFGRTAPAEVDLGCGDGSFLTALARQYPDRNFLGMERLLGRVRSACRRVAREDLNNVRVLRVEMAYAVRYLLPADSVKVFYLLFPDPWPKKRHQRRRIVTKDFLHSIHRALVHHGLLRIATDQPDYFEQMLRISETDPGFTAAGCPLNDSVFPSSTFGERLAKSKIYRLELRKVSPVREELASQLSRKNRNSTAPLSS